MAKAPAEAAQKGAKSRWRWFLIGGLIVLVAGIAAGAGLWRMQMAPSETGKTLEASRPEAGQSLLPIGRITVNVGAAGGLGEKKSRFLLIEPTLLYAASFDAAKDSKGMSEHQAALRDSFIEYLSQLHEDDVYGSAGLAELRHELLRRARLVTGSDAPIGILLQDFVLQ